MSKNLALLHGDDYSHGLDRSDSSRRRSARRQKGRQAWREDPSAPSDRQLLKHDRKQTDRSRKISSPDYTVSCLGRRSRSPSPSTVYRPMLKDLLVEHDSSEYYGTTKLEQRSRSPSPTTSIQNLALQRFFRPCSRTAVGSVANAALATAAGGFLGGLIGGRRLPPTPRSNILQPTPHQMKVPSSIIDSGHLPQPSTPTTLGQIIISPTTCLPRGISTYSLASLTGAVTPTPAATKKQMLKQIDDSIINFPSVSQSPTIPSQANRSPNSINFPKLNASPTHHIPPIITPQQLKQQNVNKSRRKQQSSSHQLNISEGQHILDSQIDEPAMIVDQDDLEGLDESLGVNVGVDGALTATSNANTTQWSSSIGPQVTNSNQTTMVSSGFGPQQTGMMREYPNVPMPNLPNMPSLRTNQPPQPNTVYIMPETQAAMNLTNQQMPGQPMQSQIPMNIQNPNYLNQRILPSTAVYKTNRNLQQQPGGFIDDVNQWC